MGAPMEDSEPLVNQAQQMTQAIPQVIIHKTVGYPPSVEQAIQEEVTWAEEAVTMIADKVPGGWYAILGCVVVAVLVIFGREKAIGAIRAFVYRRLALMGFEKKEKKDA